MPNPLCGLRSLRALRPWSRHGLVLAVAGTTYALVGLSYMTTSPNPSRQQTLAAATHWLPLPAWGAVWIIVGGLAIMSSRWPPVSKTWGYTALTGLSAGWAGFYLLGIAAGAPRTAWSGVFVWALMAFLWWAISGLVNPSDIVARRETRNRGR